MNDETIVKFEGNHIFGKLGGYPHCIFCGKWRGEDDLPEKCAGPRHKTLLLLPDEHKTYFADVHFPHGCSVEKVVLAQDFDTLLHTLRFERENHALTVQTANRQRDIANERAATAEEKLEEEKKISYSAFKTISQLHKDALVENSTFQTVLRLRKDALAESIEKLEKLNKEKFLINFGIIMLGLIAAITVISIFAL